MRVAQGCCGESHKERPVGCQHREPGAAHREHVQSQLNLFIKHKTVKSICANAQHRKVLAGCPRKRWRLNHKLRDAIGNSKTTKRFTLVDVRYDARRRTYHAATGRQKTPQHCCAIRLSGAHTVHDGEHTLLIQTTTTYDIYA